MSEPRASLRDVWIVVSDENGVREMALPPKRRLTVGRSRTCDVVLDDGSVSREHAAIFEVAGMLHIEDLGSRNQTRVMGRPLDRGESATVTIGTVVSIGHATLLLQRGRSTAPDSVPTTPSGSVLTSRGRPARPPAPGVLVVDPAMQHLHALLDVIGPSPLSVLLLGETGTGKEIFAEALHARSARASAPLVRINCATLSGSLLESELFGYEKGAFTGAHVAKPGLFEAAHGGTLLLDEIAEMPLDTQAKVLRVIEHGEVTRIGSVVPRKIDVRFIAATHHDLPALANDGRFRADLFFRLNGYTMTIPPLRERKDEIIPLARLFLERARPSHALGAHLDFAADALARLGEHTWPGNVRELRAVVDRATILAGAGPIAAEHLYLSEAASSTPTPEETPAVGAPFAPLRSRRSSFEYQHILQVLEQARGDRKAAAALLGIAYRTLLEKLAENGHPSSRKKKS